MCTECTLYNLSVCTAVLPACVHKDGRFLVGDELVNGASLRGLKMDQVGIKEVFERSRERPRADSLLLPILTAPSTPSCSLLILILILSRHMFSILPTL